MATHGPNCKQEEVAAETCYLRFGPQKVAGAIALRWESVRGEMVVVDLSKEGQVVGIELIQPGMKPCQPTWVHAKPIDLEVLKEDPKEQTMRVAGTAQEKADEDAEGEDDEEPDDE